MEPKHRNLLRSSRMRLCNDMDGDLVASHLFSAGILSANHKDSIKAELTPFKKNEQLLDLLPLCGPRAFVEFCRVLKVVHPNDKGLSEFDVNPPTKDRDEEPDIKKALVENNQKTFEDAVDLDNSDGRWLGKSKQPSILPQNIDPPPTYGGSYTTNMQSDDFYDMNKFPRGFMILINNKDFLPSSGMENYPRNGTDVDAEAMEKLFVDLGYVVQPHRNVTCSEIKSIMKQAAGMNFGSTNSFVCAILSHGQEGVIYGIDGTVEIRQLTAYFRGSNLAGKPKIFIFQACQGSEYMDSVDVTDAPVDERGNDVTLPTESDFVYAYSTVPGYYSWRNSIRGSWFIQAIVETFRQNAHKMDLIRMLTRVNQIVSTKKSATGQRASNNKRQISTIITQLRKELFFFPPGGPLSTTH